MRTLPFSDPAEVKTALDAALEVAASGGVILIPTESYYGLGVDPRRRDAVRRVFELKGRPDDIALPVVCSDRLQVESLVTIPVVHHLRLSRIWPAALTVVAPCKEDLPAANDGTLAVRIPDHGMLRALLYRVGPLTATSANRHGEAPHTGVTAALESLLGSPDLVLDGGELAGGLVSTVVDLGREEACVLRSGPVAWEQVFDPEMWVLQDS